MTDATVRHLWALDAPTMTVDCSILQVGTGGENVTIPTPAFLIEHQHGLVLFDTALASVGAGDPAAAYGAEGAAAYGIDFRADQRLDRQLESLGLKTTDVRRVVISHLHFDHSGGLDLFPHAEGFIGAGELRYARTPNPVDAGFYRPPDLEAAAKLQWNEIPAGYDHDLFGDGSVTILSLPGHTVGALGLRVRLPDRTIVFSGDAAHRRSSIDGEVGMPFDLDSANKRDSLRKLKLLRSQPDTTLWINHDPEHWVANRPDGPEIR